MKKLKRQKKIRFKVVKHRTRYSCVVHGSSKYGLKYDPKTEVHALPETLGVICFTTYKKAYNFIRQHWYYGENCMIIKVIPMGKGSTPQDMGPPSRLHDFYTHGAVSHMTPPDGTICYPAVYVVD
jgi:hypothetical protein